MAADRHAERFEGEPGDVHPGFDGLLADGFEEERLAGPGRRAADDQVLPAADPFQCAQRRPACQIWSSLQACGWTNVPSMKVRTSRPWSSCPSPTTWGAPAKPTRSRCPSRACTVGVQGPAGRRTVSPRRNTRDGCPPGSGRRVMESLEDTDAPHGRSRGVRQPGVARITGVLVRDLAESHGPPP
jgi:hypothetical protein